MRLAGFAEPPEIKDLEADIAALENRKKMPSVQKPTKKPVKLRKSKKRNGKRLKKSVQSGRKREIAVRGL